MINMQVNGETCVALDREVRREWEERGRMRGKEEEKIGKVRER